MAENKSPLEIVQQIGSSDLGPLRASLGGSKRATFAFVFWLTSFSVAYQLAVPAVWACALFASAIVLGTYMIGQSIIEAHTVTVVGDNPAEGDLLAKPAPPPKAPKA